ncbi:hypothetical protein SUGI_0938490 [Cryptomeria japonica]|nr:hypothetical protein SUGI_0938490 [Cryptomeria japonica]
MDQRSYPNGKAQQITCLIQDLQQRLQGSPVHPQQLAIAPLNLPFQLSFIGRMQFRMAVLPILLKAAVKQKKIIEEQQLNFKRQMESQKDLQLMLEESADMYAGLEFEYENKKVEFESLKYRIRKLIFSSASILGSVRDLLQRDRDLPELTALMQSKDFLCVCQGIIVEAATDLLDSCHQHNTESMSATILLLQRISELPDGRNTLIELEMDHNRENQNDRKTLLWALVVLFRKQSSCRHNIVMIMLTYTNSKDGARLLIAHQLDNVLVSMLHSEMDQDIKEISVDILCSLVSLNDSRLVLNPLRLLQNLSKP